MNTLVLRCVASRTIARAALTCVVFSATLTGGAALVVLLTGTGGELRRELAFDFSGIEPSLANAAAIMLHNAIYPTMALTGAYVRPRLARWQRTACDTLLAFVLVMNAVSIGVALGAYGARILAAIVTHQPLELAAFALATGAYMRLGHTPLTTRELAATAIACSLLIAAAALLETYVWLP